MIRHVAVVSSNFRNTIEWLKQLTEGRGALDKAQGAVIDHKTNTKYTIISGVESALSCEFDECLIDPMYRDQLIETVRSRIRRR